MRVTTFSDYALRVLMYLAVQADRRATVDEIAAAYGISSNHLTKVVHLLGRAGWVQTVRGKGGGLRLGQPAESIRLGEVVRLCEGSAAYVECMVVDLSHHCRIAPACKLSGILSGAFKVFYAELDKHTLADLVQTGHSNDALSTKMHRLTLALLRSAQLPPSRVLDTLTYHLREDFAIPHAAFRAWGAASEFAELSMSGAIEGPLAELWRRASAGDGIAACQLGDAFREGRFGLRESPTQTYYWYARSAEFLQLPWIVVLRWMRMVGDGVFIVGTLSFAWFMAGLWFGWSYQPVATEEPETVVAPGAVRS